MKAKLIGTGPSEGVPAPLCDCKYCERNNRTRPSLLVSNNGKNLLFDIGPDVKQQLNSNNVTQIDGIFVTHFHFDHCNGLRDLYNMTIRPTRLGIEDKAPDKIINYLGQTFDVYWSPFTNEKIRDEISYAMNGHGFNTTLTEGDTVQKAGLEITSFVAEHSRGYIGFVIESDDRKIVYTPDHGNLRTELDFENVDILIYDASALLGYEVHGTKKNFVETIQRIDPDKIYFTNVSEHAAQKSTNELKDVLDIENGQIVEDNYEIL